MQPSRPSSRGWGGRERDCRPRAKVYSPPASHSTVARAEKREAQPFRTTTWGQHVPGTKMSPCGREHRPAACIPGGHRGRGTRGGPPGHGHSKATGVPAGPSWLTAKSICVAHSWGPCSRSTEQARGSWSLRESGPQVWGQRGRRAEQGRSYAAAV